MAQYQFGSSLWRRLTSTILALLLMLTLLQHRAIAGSNADEVAWWLNLCKTNNGITFCAPPEKTPIDIFKALQNYQESNKLPDNFTEYQAIQILAKVFPCQNSNIKQISPPKIAVKKNNKFTDFSVEGSLATKNDIGCIPITKATNKLTPPDLYKGSIVCMMDDKILEGSKLFALAGIFANFDAERVTDITARQAKTVLIMNMFNSFPEDKKKKMQNMLTEIADKDSSRLVELCSEISAIGYPSYYPEYMILHGMKAFTGDPNENAISENFDAASTWKLLLEKYLHCPSSISKASL